MSSAVPVFSQGTENKEKADTFRQKVAKRGVKHLINGEWVASVSGETFETISPIDNSVIAEVASGSAEDIDKAAKAAAEAFKTWRNVPSKERKRLLHRVADLIESRAEEIALLEVLDTGQTVRFMSKAASRAAQNFRFFADRCEGARDGQSLPTDEHLNYTLRQPLGPVGIITPWNTPFMLSTWKMAPALAAGCTVVHKPAEWSPVTASLLAEIISEAGVPDGVVNLVNGYGESAGKALTEHTPTSRRWRSSASRSRAVTSWHRARRP